VELKVLTNF